MPPPMREGTCNAKASTPDVKDLDVFDNVKAKNQNKEGSHPDQSSSGWYCPNVECMIGLSPECRNFIGPEHHHCPECGISRPPPAPPLSPWVAFGMNAPPKQSIF